MGNNCTSRECNECPSCPAEDLTEIKQFDLTAEDAVTLARPVLPTLMLGRPHTANQVAAQKIPKANMVSLSCPQNPQDDQYRLPTLLEEGEESSRLGESSRFGTPAAKTHREDGFAGLPSLEEPNLPVPLCSEFERYLEVVFADDEGQEKCVKIYRRPLGAEFVQHPTEPTMITRVRPGTYAATLGLQPGWIVKAVAGDDEGHLGLALEGGLRRLPILELSC